MRTRHSLFIMLLGLCAAAGGQAQEPIRFARVPDISPDGKLIAFSYLGDLWVVEAIGGVARPVTVHEAHDTSPVFSPDGRQLAFSSNRHGQYDVFVSSIHGGKPRRLTFDSANDVVDGWAKDGKSILFTSRRTPAFPPVTDLYTVPVTGGKERRVTAFEGRDGVYSPDGKQIAYVRGPGTWYRRGYRGSANDDLWLCNADGTNNRQLTTFNGQDGSPMWSEDGQAIFYVSEQFGMSNICRMPVAGGSPQQVTQHTTDGVRHARISANGAWITYECGADIWLCSTNGQPNPRVVPIEAYADDKSNPDQTVTYTQDIAEYALSSNEEHIAFVVHGEIFLMPTRGGKARRLTDHPGNDHDLAWAPDMKKIAFISDRGGEDDIYVLEHNDPEHPELVKAHQFKVTQLTKTPEPESDLLFSPGGSSLAFLRDGKLWTMKPDGTDAKVLVNDTRVIEYDWSPDSKWIVYSRMDPAFASELYLVPAAGGTPVNITRYATRNFGVSWNSDGKRLAFISQRRQDLDVFVMALQKPPREGEAPKGSDIDFDDLHLRVDRATSLSSDESEVALKPDGSMVVFRSNALNGDDLWLAASNGSQVSRLTNGNLRPHQLRWSRSGTTVYFLDGSGALRYVRPGFAATSFSSVMSGVPDLGPAKINFTARMKISRDEEFIQMFDEAWRKLSYHFYDPSYHGINWAAVRLKYRPLVKHVVMHEEFYELVSLMLGELNASHLGIGGRSRTPEEQTAELGLLWDESYKGPGLKIAEILKRGPADRRNLDIKPGEFVMAINGKELTDNVNVSAVLNVLDPRERAGDPVAVQLATDPKDPKRRKVELRPVSRQDIGNLMYERWVAHNAKKVSELSGGKLGYIHLRGMNQESLDEFVRTLYSDNFDKEAIVLDVRYNGGGFTHDQVLSYLGGKEHTYFITREGNKGPVLRANDRKWTRPLVLLCNNRSYSDAEIFPSAFRALGLGKLVGLPTGGYVIGTMEDRLIDGSFFRIPRLGVFTLAGVNMEKIGVTPDVVVDLHPDQVAKGQDAQLEKAVEVLKGDVEAWKKIQRPPVAATTPAAEPKTPMPGAGNK